ncbi:LysR family transcriptional regulator [Rhizobium sp. FKL33]|uniref:LysR family transcriptional regulator n=1 Tax=Rhizobium sp. FKL33 TaxID=2562307 RepID=UPI00148538A0|nr:LysR family transcriptional regulator [Rhizobium sp. FKL33]
MSLDPRNLSILLHVARSGSFTAAAKALNMSQPAVSIAIAQLEDRVGTQVVMRDRKGATLTEAGALLLRRAQAIENILHSAEQEVAGHREQIDGPLKVGGTPGALVALAPPLIARLAVEDRGLAVQAVEARDEDLAPMLRMRAIDLALCTASREEPPSDIIEVPLQSEPFLLLAAPDNPMPDQGVSIAEAAIFPWILPLADGATRRQLEAVFLSAGVALPKTILRCDALATMKDTVRKAGFLTLLPASVVDTEIKAGLMRAVPLLDGPPPRRLAIWRMRGDDLSAPAARFIAGAQALSSP